MLLGISPELIFLDKWKTTHVGGHTGARNTQIRVDCLAVCLWPKGPRKQMVREIRSQFSCILKTPWKSLISDGFGGWRLGS